VVVLVVGFFVVLVVDFFVVLVFGFVVLVVVDRVVLVVDFFDFVVVSVVDAAGASDDARRSTLTYVMSSRLTSGCKTIVDSRSLTFLLTLVTFATGTSGGNTAPETADVNSSSPSVMHVSGDAFF
jgi:hypothetical protein